MPILQERIETPHFHYNNLSAEKQFPVGKGIVSLPTGN
ncbi:hypothetical protein CAPGI0001_2362 [Capnocytophaga gingivalis ATCC 33624]|nr:hypothetical protein CAPGI0001_2362 [Capnocytophaga gingivalis ATCC 33624]